MNLPLKPEKWTPEQWFRFWIHFPIGIVCSLLLEYKPVHGILATIWFIVYEIFNEWRKHDHSYKDIIGGVAGFFTASIVLGIIWLIKFWF